MESFYLALCQHADVYHFHDPELIFIGILLKLLDGFPKNKDIKMTVEVAAIDILVIFLPNNTLLTCLLIHELLLTLIFLHLLPEIIK